MAVPSLSLVVLRVADIEVAASFYSLFGLSFTKHRHGKGPEHYAAELGSSVFEIYPQSSPDQTTKYVRLGFLVADGASILSKVASVGGVVVSEMKESEWGRRGVVDDPFGHRIELTEPKTC